MVPCYISVLPRLDVLLLHGFTYAKRFKLHTRYFDDEPCLSLRCTNSTCPLLIKVQKYYMANRFQCLCDSLLGKNLLSQVKNSNALQFTITFVRSHESYVQGSYLLTAKSLVFCIDIYLQRSTVANSPAFCGRLAHFEEELQVENEFL